MRIAAVVGSFGILAVLAHGAPAVAHTPTRTPLIFTSNALPKTPTSAVRAASKALSRADAPVVTAAGTGPEQAGFVHYFVITGPDGEPESQVGIEMPGNRIAWSFPELGVVVSPFIAAGTIVANGKSYDVEHVYGIRPFVDDRSMHTLQRDLQARVAPWIENKTPYCDEERPALGACVSCLGFLLRILFPGATPDYPALPPDFKSARKNIYTTEDLLLYLAGVSPGAAPRARLKRIESLAIPEELREELARISTAIEPKTSTVAAKGMKQGAIRHIPGTRSVVQLPRRAIPRRRS